MNSGDPARVDDMLVEDVEYADHRPLGWGELHGRDQVAAWFAESLTGAAEVRFANDVLADRGDRAALRQTLSIRAHAADGGGEAELVFFLTLALRGAQMTRIEIFETEDEARAALG
jgi:hypothetical protein